MKRNKNHSPEQVSSIERNIDKPRILDHKGFLKLMCLEREYLSTSTSI